MRETTGGTGAAQAIERVMDQRARLSRLSQLGGFARRFPLGAAGALTLLTLVLVAALAPQIAPYDPLEQDIPNRLTGPSSQFWLGTDDLGRDLFSRILFGARVSLYVGLMAVALGTVVGTPLGVASGYSGGWFDLLSQRIVDALMGFPSLVLAMVLVVALGASINNVTLAIGVMLAPRVMRLARSSALSIKEEVYVLAAQAIGASGLRVILRHVLPNALAPVFILATGYLGTAIIIEATLSFLGLGVPAPYPSWGNLLQLGTGGNLESAPWMAIFPGVALCVTIFSAAFLGDALRDALDPRLRGT